MGGKEYEVAITQKKRKYDDWCTPYFTITEGLRALQVCNWNLK
jgi:hypothetical protein